MYYFIICIFVTASYHYCRSLPYLLYHSVSMYTPTFQTHTNIQHHIHYTLYVCIYKLPEVWRVIEQFDYYEAVSYKLSLHSQPNMFERFGHCVLDSVLLQHHQNTKGVNIVKIHRYRMFDSRTSLKHYTKTFSIFLFLSQLNHF